MSDLTLAQLAKAYDATLEQIAAESFLVFGMQPGDFIERLQAGKDRQMGSGMTIDLFLSSRGQGLSDARFGDRIAVGHIGSGQPTDHGGIPL